MKYVFCACLLLLLALTGLSQENSPYLDSLHVFRNDYINTHEVVTTKEDKALLRFYPIDASYRVKCHFEKIDGDAWVPIATSTITRQIMRH